MPKYDKSQLQNLLVELSRPNPKAWDRAAESFHAMPRQDGDPIYEALRLRVDAGASQEALLEKQRELSPAHGFWLEHAPVIPLGFVRLMLETARLQSSYTDEIDLGSLLPARAYLQLEALRNIDLHGLRQLRALSAAHLAGKLNQKGLYREARAVVKTAVDGLGMRPDEEIKASVEEIRSKLLWGAGACDMALRILEEAAEELSLIRIPGRRAELQLTRGRLHLQRNEPDIARPLLLDARGLCPEDRALSLRFEVLHALTYTEIRLRNYEEAGRFLEETRKLESYGQQVHKGESLWYEGRIALLTGHPQEAEESFRAALGHFGELKDWRRAAFMLVDLTEALAIGDRLDEKTIQELIPHFSDPQMVESLDRNCRGNLESLRRRFADRDQVAKLVGFLDRKGDSKAG